MPETRGVDLESTGVLFGTQGARGMPVLKSLRQLVSKLSRSLRLRREQNAGAQVGRQGIELETRG